MAEEEKKEQQEQEEVPTLAELLASNEGYKTEYETMLTAEREKWQSDAQQEQSEARKLEKMTAAERREYKLSQGEQRLAEKMAEFERRQLVVQTGEELGKRGLPSSMAKWLAGKDADATKANIDAYEQDYRKAVQEGINGAMRGKTPPKEPTQPNAVTRDSIKNMSRDEIVKAYDEGRFNELLGRK